MAKEVKLTIDEIRLFQATAGVNSLYSKSTREPVSFSFKNIQHLIRLILF